MRTCAQASSIRAMPENEIPPAMRVDIYCALRQNGNKKRFSAAFAYGIA